MPRKKNFRQEYCDLVKEEIRLNAILLTEALKRKEIDHLRDLLERTQREQYEGEKTLQTRIEQQAKTIRTLETLLSDKNNKPVSWFARLKNQFTYTVSKVKSYDLLRSKGINNE